MKKLMCIVLVMLSAFSSSAQPAATDAVTLSRYLDLTANPVTFNSDAASLKEVAGIIKKYYPAIATLDRDAIINSIITPGSDTYNPILAPFLNVNLPAEADQAAEKSFFAAAGNLNVTNFADGIAKFLVKRSKEELNVAFFRKLQEFLKKYPEVKIIFPGTVKVIENIVSYNYAAMLPALRASFQKDFNSISGNLVNLRDVGNYEGYLTSKTIQGQADTISHFLTKDLAGRSIIACLLAADGIGKGDNAAEVISAVAADRLCIDFPTDNFSNTIMLTDLLSKSLRSSVDGRLWIGKDEINQLLKNDPTIQLYLGLLYAMDQSAVHQIQFDFSPSPKVSLQNTLVKINASVSGAIGTDFKGSIKNLATAASDVSDNVANIAKVRAQGGQSSILIYGEYASSVARFLKVAVGLLESNPKTEASFANLAADVKKFSDLIDDALDCCYDLKSQSYASLVLHSAAVLSDIAPVKFSNYKDDYIKYGTFMASIIEAKNSNEVAAAFDAAVLPVGSSSVKRETYFNIALNSFIGPFAGREYLPKLKDKKWATVTGITAPVGVAFSWGKLKGKRDTHQGSGKTVGGKSFSIFVPLIDVGAMAAFRLSDDSSSVSSEVKLKNIISPGLYLYYGFGKCPVSIGAGAQLGPQLREIDAKNINIDKNYYIRFGLNVVVDIPFFNFYTKTN